jgi:hypothetical protein
VPWYFSLLLTLLGWLLQWLVKKSQTGGTTPSQIASLNGLIFRQNQITDAAVRVGCSPVGREKC